MLLPVRADNTAINGLMSGQHQLALYAWPFFAREGKSVGECMQTIPNVKSDVAGRSVMRLESHCQSKPTRWTNGVCLVRLRKYHMLQLLRLKTPGQLPNLESERGGLEK